VAAVKSRLHRARADVRDRVAPLLAPAASPSAASPPAASPSAASPPAVVSPAVAACPDVVGLLSRHLEGDIGRDACAEMEKHVAACPRCLSACESLRQTLRLCGSTPAPEVPGPLQESIRRGIRGVLAGSRAGPASSSP
jgi:RNA polymerase sigma-70 factor (ECF subfamily)